MKNWFKDAFFVLAEVVGFFVMGLIIFPLIAILGFIYTFFKHILKRDYSAKKHFKPLVRAMSLVSDCGANACGGELINDLSKAKEGEVKYGNWNQTISSVSGLRFVFNKRDSAMRRFLNKIEKDHCEKAPTEMELFYYRNR